MYIVHSGLTGLGGTIMKNKNAALPILAIGIIVILFTLAVFFLLRIERNALNLWALSFLLLSEVIVIGGLIGVRRANAEHGAVFMRAGITTTLTLYLAAVAVCSILAELFSSNLNAFILVQLGIFALFAIITISILAFSRGLGRRESEDATKVGSNEAKRGGF